MAHDSSSSHVPYQKAYGSLSGKSGAQIWVEIQAVHSHLWRSDRSTMLHHGPRSKLLPFSPSIKTKGVYSTEKYHAAQLDSGSTKKSQSAWCRPKRPKRLFYKNTANTFCTAPWVSHFEGQFATVLLLQVSLIYSARAILALHRPPWLGSWLSFHSRAKKSPETSALNSWMRLTSLTRHTSQRDKQKQIAKETSNCTTKLLYHLQLPAFKSSCKTKETPQALLLAKILIRGGPNLAWRSLAVRRASTESWATKNPKHRKMQHFGWFRCHLFELKLMVFFLTLSLSLTHSFSPPKKNNNFKIWRWSKVERLKGINFKRRVGSFQVLVESCKVELNPAPSFPQEQRAGWPFRCHSNAFNRRVAHVPCIFKGWCSKKTD